MTPNELTNKNCAPCNGQIPLLQPQQVEPFIEALHNDWGVSDDGKLLSRRYVFKGFAKSVYLANLCAWLADQQGHHPDIAFGWGYCTVNLTTHDLDGLSENDFIWAAKLDNLTAGNVAVG